MREERFRAFIAIGLPDPVRDALARQQELLRPILPQVSWVRPEAIHLTLHFLGDVSPRLATDLERAIGRAVAHLPRFELTVRGLGLFPGPRNPRVLWAKVEDAFALTEVHRACGAVLRGRKLRIEQRRYHPHLTLARIRTPLSDEALDALRAILDGPPEELGRIPVDEVRLYSSELRSDGARYRVLGRAPLGD